MLLLETLDTFQYKHNHKFRKLLTEMESYQHYCTVRCTYAAYTVYSVCTCSGTCEGLFRSSWEHTAWSLPTYTPTASPQLWKHSQKKKIFWFLNTLREIAEIFQHVEGKYERSKFSYLSPSSFSKSLTTLPVVSSNKMATSSRTISRRFSSYS